MQQVFFLTLTTNLLKYNVEEAIDLKSKNDILLNHVIAK